VLSRRAYSYPGPDSTPNPLRLTLLQTLCHCEEIQLLCNQANPHSFSRTPGVGHTLKSHSRRINNIRTLCSQPSCNLVNATLLCSPFVFITLRIAFFATHLFSQSSELPGGVGPQCAATAQPLLELRQQVAVEMPAPAARHSKYVAAKLSVAGVSENEQKLRSTRILYCDSPKPMSFSDVNQDARTRS
jgi:hypothetical protein